MQKHQRQLTLFLYTHTNKRNLDAIAAVATQEIAADITCLREELNRRLDGFNHLIQDSLYEYDHEIDNGLSNIDKIRADIMKKSTS